MALEIFRAISNLRMVLDTETDADSPDNETTFKAMREMIEILFQLMVDTGASGTATSNPPNDATGVLTDTGAAYSVDEHNGRTLVMCSGLAKGNFYIIDDTTATTIVCTGDNLYSDGVRSGDDYKILFDIKSNLDGHDHDNINSPSVVLADGQVVEAKLGTGAVTNAKLGASAVAQAKLKTSQGSASTISTSLTNLILPGGEYGFYPKTKASHTADAEAQISAYETVGTSYVTRIGLRCSGGYTFYAQQRYVTSSGEIHWIFILRDKITKKVVSMYQAPDHPCFGNSGKPLLTSHPFGDIGLNKLKDGIDSNKYEIIVINPTNEEIEQMELETIVDDETKPDKDLLEVITENYEIDENSNPAWPSIPVTVGLPKHIVDKKTGKKILADYRFMPADTVIEPIKKIIPKPDYIKVKSLKKR